MNLTRLLNVEKIHPYVTRILGRNPGLMTLQGTNSYVVGNPSVGQLLIDTTSAVQNNLESYLENIRETFVAPLGIAITHSHADHVGAINPVLLTLQSTICEEIPIYKIEVPGVLQLSTLGLVSKSLIHLKDKHIITLSPDCAIEALATPGHAMDHSCFIMLIDARPFAVFTGDHILGHGTTAVQSLFHYMQSLETLRTFLRGPGKSVRYLFPGHGPVIEQPLEKVEEYIRHREARIEQCKCFLLQQERNTVINEESLLSSVYQNLSPGLVPAALTNLRHCLFFLHQNDDTLALQLPEEQEGSVVTFEQFTARLGDIENTKNASVTFWNWMRC